MGIAICERWEYYTCDPEVSELLEVAEDRGLGSLYRLYDYRQGNNGYRIGKTPTGKGRGRPPRGVPEGFASDYLNGMTLFLIEVKYNAHIKLINRWREGLGLKRRWRGYKGGKQ